MIRMKAIAPISAVVATRNRPEVFARTLQSLRAQEISLAELIIIDASEDEKTKELVASLDIGTEIFASVRADFGGVGRRSGAKESGCVKQAAQPFVWFFDDDIVFEPKCMERLGRAIEADAGLGGVNAMIVNQRYQPPGLVSRSMFALMNGGSEQTYAGRVIGPAINLLPEDRDDLPSVVPVEWLNNNSKADLSPGSAAVAGFRSFL